eukprot:CAMPEP_0176337366 /NCGR_PEP_ID=MMETSP0121_2-20121125/79593_1 /TAXON_ID=160619 /ORGANISM="Kryptoperidinium foliaceum, Strain CCMP 1326" /LENGTH=64 /DNA_ID=CAMNT_0017680369 /DNA_START=1021 /DNA_END=1211 /DNA_ORIENTATION=-
MSNSARTPGRLRISDPSWSSFWIPLREEEERHLNQEDRVARQGQRGAEHNREEDDARFEVLLQV